MHFADKWVQLVATDVTPLIFDVRVLQQKTVLHVTHVVWLQSVPVGVVEAEKIELHYYCDRKHMYVNVSTLPIYSELDSLGSSTVPGQL